MSVVTDFVGAWKFVNCEELREVLFVFKWGRIQNFSLPEIIFRLIYGF